MTNKTNDTTATTTFDLGGDPLLPTVMARWPYCGGRWSWGSG
ncbi:hypothetical protein [Streptosporangium carneum]|nr:hypothetical protein [Streptosporangium carneum]